MMHEQTSEIGAKKASPFFWPLNFKCYFGEVLHFLCYPNVVLQLFPY